MNTFIYRSFTSFIFWGSFLLFPSFNYAQPTTTKESSKKTNLDHETYSYVMFGSTSWMSKNLNTSTFKNGDIIPEAKTDAAWQKFFEAGKPAWCYYNFDAVNGVKYGKLYNFFAVHDERGLAPTGWHIPSDLEWKTLNIGFNGDAGKKMKSLTGWNNNGNGTNIGSFWAVPGGYYEDPSKSFEEIGSVGRWWSSGHKTIMGFEFGNYVELSSDHDHLSVDGFTDSGGLSVRCIKN